jgi:hypothetical protein
MAAVTSAREPELDPKEARSVSPERLVMLTDAVVAYALEIKYFESANDAWDWLNN